MADERKPNEIIESVKRGWTGFRDWMGENTAHKVIFGFSSAAVVAVAASAAVVGPVAQNAIMAIPAAVVDPEPAADDEDKSDDKKDEKSDDDTTDATDASATGANATDTDETPSTATNTPASANTSDETPQAATNTSASANSNTSSNSGSSSSSSSSNNSSSSSSNSNNSSNSGSSTPAHTHTWVTKTRTVTDTEAHWQITKQAWDEIVTTTDTSCKHYRCSRCGAVGGHNLGEVVHNVSNCTGTLSVITRQDNPTPTTKNTTKHHDAEREWVAATTHEESYEVCSGCGQTR